jgi:hypothetical protein
MQRFAAYLQRHTGVRTILSDPAVRLVLFIDRLPKQNYEQLKVLL